MKPFVRPRLGVEVLESRECPTVSLRYVAGGLFIWGRPNSDLSITGQSSGLFKITDGTNDLGSYRITKFLDIRLSSRPGFLDIDLAGKVLAGNVYINLGNGFTGNPATKLSTVDIYDSTATTGLSTGQIRGNVTIVRGNGGETINIGANKINLVTTNVNPLTIRGNVAYGAPISPNKVDSLTITDATIIGGYVATSQVEQVIIGEEAVGIAGFSKIGRHLTITYNGVNAGLKYQIAGTIGGNITLKAGASSSKSSNVFLLQPADATNDTTVLGKVTVTLGNSFDGNRFSILNPTGASTTLIQGNVLFRSLNGILDPGSIDRVEHQGFIEGDLGVQLGEGDNEFSFGDTTPDAFINGEFTYVGGNNSNLIGVTGVFTNFFNGEIGGDVTIVVGNGVNDTFIGTGISGVLTYRGGNFQDTVTLAPAVDDTYLYMLDILFGVGTNTLELDASAVFGPNQMFINGVIEAAPGASNTFTLTDPNSTLVLLPTLQQINFP